MNSDENNGFDVGEIERWLFNYFRIGMTKVGGFPVLPGDDAPDRNDLFFRMIKHFGNDVRGFMMYHHVWTIH